MDSTQTEAAHLIEDYLTGRLPANEIDALEQRVSRDPAIREEIERALKLKEGLARLRERGQLDALLRVSAPRRWRTYAAAASVAIASLAVVMWLQLRNPGTPVLFLASGESAQQYHLAGTYTLARTRGNVEPTDLTLTSKATLVRLKIVPAADPITKLGYTVGLHRVDPGGVNPLGQIKAAPVGPDGYLTVYIDGGQLSPGTYELLVTPAVPNGSSAESDRFVLQLR